MDAWSGFHDTDKQSYNERDTLVALEWFKFRQHTDRLATFFIGATLGRKS